MPLRLASRSHGDGIVHDRHDPSWTLHPRTQQVRDDQGNDHGMEHMLRTIQRNTIYTTTTTTTTANDGDTSDDDHEGPTNPATP